MIGLLIQDNAYEQDIRELLMSFYPGETYAHEVKEGVDFYVQTRLEDGEAVIGIWEKLENGEELEGWTLTAHSTGKADLSDHSATKNVIKKLFYQMGFSYRDPSYQDRIKPSGRWMEGRRHPQIHERNLHDQR